MRNSSYTRFKFAKKRIKDVSLAVFAVAFTIFPLVSISYMAYDKFHDPREVSALSVINAEGDVKLFEEPLVSVTFDDGWRSIYDKAAPLLDKYNIRTTQYVLPAAVKDRNYFSSDQIVSLSNSGHEIASHGFDHLDFTVLDSSKLDFQLSESKNLLRGILGKDPKHFASPLGSRNQNTIRAIGNHYQSHRNTQADIHNGVDTGDFNLRQNFNRFDIIAFTVQSNTTYGQIKAALEYAKKHNAWFVLTYHQVDQSKSQYSVTAETLENHLKLIRESGIKTPTVGDVIGSSFRK